MEERASVANRRDDLVVDGVSQRLADLVGGAPPQQMHADGADGDGRQHEGGNGGADAEAHEGPVSRGRLTALRDHSSVCFASEANF
jgi:hypothetical protein